MSTALYRIRGGEVLKVSTTDQPFSNIDTSFYSVATEPLTPDGTDVRSFNVSTGILGPMRELGYAKIFVAPKTIRNATAGEIASFATAEEADNSEHDADRAEHLFETHPQFRKLLIAMADIIKDEVNLLRARDRDRNSELQAATSLANIKTRWASLATLNDRTLVQFRNQIKNRISKDD